MCCPTSQLCLDVHLVLAILPPDNTAACLVSVSLPCIHLLPLLVSFPVVCYASPPILSQQCGVIVLPQCLQCSAATRVRPLPSSWQHTGTLLNIPRAPQAMQ